jgi:lipopolysaccharide/colanic/teichoic acid biosynthesis glycosyltransferase
MIVLLSPLLVLVAVIVKLTSRGPVLFRQERVGLDGRPFTLLKFRSMIVTDDDTALREIVQLELAGERSAQGGSFKVLDDPRVTRVGRVMRSTSIDELPQLFNVLRGEMSLVGPRPALQWEADMFPPEYQRRTTVPPGITGLWQVSGRSTLGTLDMLRLDVEYVDTWSLGMDLRILMRTLPVLVRGDGAR